MRSLYRSADEDSARWEDVEVRLGDVVVSSRSKTGTTWVQLICLLLVTGEPRIASIGALSPWIDHLVEPIGEVVARLDAQDHRRVVKTHTPLDGVPLDARATYVVVARHPLDAAVSMWHQGNNIDRARLANLTGAVPPDGPAAPRTGLEPWLADWACRETTAAASMDSLVGHLHHATDAWARSRREGADVVLVHYADLRADLSGQVARLARRLGVVTDPGRVAQVVEEVGFASMRGHASMQAPDTLGILRDPAAFFRSGRSGEGRELLGEQRHAAFERRCRRLAPAEVVDWLLR